MNPVTPATLVAVPLPNGTYRVLWILEASTVGVMSRKGKPVEEKAYFNFLIMEGFHPSIPGQDDLPTLRVAEDPQGPFPGRENVWKGSFFGDVPGDFAVIGQRALPGKDHAFFELGGTMVFQDGEDCRAQLFRAWRLIHDRPALEAEWAQADAERQRRNDERRRIRTLPKMLREPVFASWSEMWPPRVVREARRIFRDATRELIALEEAGTKRQRTVVLKRIVTEFNALDDKEGCIETVEREQIVARIEALAGLVGISNEGEALTGHRDW
jgi:hypothetical protein